jgi:hypothetical protein
VTRPRPRALPPLLGALLALGNCGPPLPERPSLPQAETPAERACLAEARNSQPVRDLERQRNPQNTANWERLASEATARINSAYRNCLVREGLTLPGGVEAQRPR